MIRRRKMQNAVLDDRCIHCRSKSGSFKQHFEPEPFRRSCAHI